MGGVLQGMRKCSIRVLKGCNKVSLSLSLSLRLALSLSLSLSFFFSLSLSIFLGRDKGSVRALQRDYGTTTSIPIKVLERVCDFRA